MPRIQNKYIFKPLIVLNFNLISLLFIRKNHFICSSAIVHCTSPFGDNFKIEKKDISMNVHRRKLPLI